ncbi:hypothetical protein GCM10017706_28750 [Lactococcus lactis subsp. hordniae]
MNIITTDPLFGFVLTVLVFMIGVRINENFRKPWTNPLLFATVVIILILSLAHIPYKNYYIGVQLSMTLLDLVPLLLEFLSIKLST